MTKIRAFLTWTVQNRHIVAFILLALAGGAFKYRADVRSPEARDLSHQTSTISYLGKLTETRSRDGRYAGSTNFDGGYGIGMANDQEKNPLMQRLRPEVYMQFAEPLHVTEQDISNIRSAGDTFTLSTWRGQIVAVTGPQGPIISYERYATQIERSKQISLIVSICLAMGAVLSWIACSVAARRASPAAPLL